MTRRRGFTLIELLVAMAGASAILGMAVAMVYTLLEADRAGRQRMHVGESLGRLADQFRRDVHAARAVAPLAPAGGKKRSPGWQLRLDDRRSVRYGVREGKLVRSEHVEGKAVRQDSFALPHGATMSVQPDAGGRPAAVRLSIEPAAGPAEKWKGPAIHVDAVLGRDHRFTKHEETGEHAKQPKP